MGDGETIVIVGGGEAGGRAALRLRDAGCSGEVKLICREPHLPYERPSVSKQLLWSADTGLPLHVPAARYAERSIDIVHATVAGIDRAARQAALSDGTSLGYSRLLLACGARPRRLGIVGADLPGVIHLRDAAHGFDLRARLVNAHHLLVVGGGFIGLEVAASARKLGCRVTLVERADRLMARAVPAAVSNTFATFHRSAGVDLRLGVEPVTFVGEEWLESAHLSDGTIVNADVAIVGIGVVPRVELASASGLTVDDGIVVDSACRTSDPAIFAVGDVARQHNDWAGHSVRLESWQSARDQADLAVGAMLGRENGSPRPPWMWSDQYEHGLQVLGFPDLQRSFQPRGDVASGAYALFQLAEGRLSAAITVNRPADMAAAKKIMAARVAVRAASLCDPDVRLRSLAA